jgi:hypothetical protein
MIEPHKRRWFRFSFRLRTLFLVVTAIALTLGWAMWNVRQVRQRERVEQYLSLCKCEVIPGTSPRPWNSMPAMWSMFGAKPVRTITLRNIWVTDEDVPHIKYWFPEADIIDNRPRNRPQ